jgi:hypothetical protein
VAVEKKAGIGVSNGILHYEGSYIAHVKVEVVVEVERVRAGGGGAGRSGRERKDLVVALLIESLGVGEQEVAGVDVLVDRLERSHRLGWPQVRVDQRRTGAARPKVKEAAEHDCFQGRFEARQVNGAG